MKITSSIILINSLKWGASFYPNEEKKRIERPSANRETDAVFFFFPFFLYFYWHDIIKDIMTFFSKILRFYEKKLFTQDK